MCTALQDTYNWAVGKSSDAAGIRAWRQSLAQELHSNESGYFRVKHKALRYWLSPTKELYKKSFMGSYLHCVHPDKVQDILFEIHKGICGSYVGGRSVAHRVILQRCWWP